MTPKECEVLCQKCGFHALTASEQAIKSKAFVKVACMVMTDHTRTTGHTEYRVIPA